MEPKILNLKIVNKEKELLAAEKRIVGFSKDFEMALATAERKLAELYAETKDKDFSSIEKRQRIALAEPEIKKLQQRVDEAEYNLKLDKIELSSMKREFRILELSLGGTSHLASIAFSLNLIATKGVPR